MANPARKPPPGTHIDTADILAAIHELGERVERRFAKVDSDISKLDDRARKIETDVAEVKGRLGELSARVPSVWTIAAMIVSLFGASFVLIRFASGH